MKITLIGLGVREGDMSMRAVNALTSGAKVLARTALAPSFASVKDYGAQPLDELFARSRNFDTLNRRLAKAVLDAAKQQDVVYCVDGAVCEDCPARGLQCALRHRCYRGSLAQTAVVAAAYALHRRLGTWRGVTLLAPTEFDRAKLLEFNRLRPLFDPERLAVKPNPVRLPRQPIEAHRARRTCARAVRIEKGGKAQRQDLVAAVAAEHVFGRDPFRRGDRRPQSLHFQRRIQFKGRKIEVLIRFERRGAGRVRVFVGVEFYVFFVRRLFPRRIRRDLARGFAQKALHPSPSHAPRRRPCKTPRGNFL